MRHSILLVWVVVFSLFVEVMDPSTSFVGDRIGDVVKAGQKMLKSAAVVITKTAQAEAGALDSVDYEDDGVEPGLFTSSMLYGLPIACKAACNLRFERSMFGRFFPYHFELSPVLNKPPVGLLG